MGGWPVWLASASIHRRGQLLPTRLWDDDRRASVESSLATLLDGVGDPERERLFRMPSTLCRHRALSQAEHDQLPEQWHGEVATDIAGGPVEVLWHHGVPDTLSTQPCEHQRSEIGAMYGQDLECGSCGPCVARAEAVGGPCACQR